MKEPENRKEPRLIKELESGNKVTRYVVCAASRYGDVVVPGARHFDSVMTPLVCKLKEAKFIKGTADEQGFIDQFGEFMDRWEALAVAENTGQMKNAPFKCAPQDRLFSEDLYHPEP